MKQLTLSQAVSIEGFLLEKQAQHLSPHTVADYTNAFRKLQAYLGTDVPFAGITADQIKGFLGDLSTPRAPERRGEAAGQGALQQDHPQHPHRALGALDVGGRRGDRQPAPPAPDPPAQAREARDHAFQRGGHEDAAGLPRQTLPRLPRPGKRACDHAVTTALRNRTIILLLLDTGVRASELCGLTIKDADLTNKRILVLGKGTLCEELGVADLPAHCQDAVALPDD